MRMSTAELRPPESPEEIYANTMDNLFSWPSMERPFFKEFNPWNGLDDLRVLDVGCGAGRMISHFIDEGVPADQITGVDTNPRMVELARARVPGTHIIEADIAEWGATTLRRTLERELPSEDLGTDGKGISFDLITANMVFGYMSRIQIQRAMKNISSLMSNRGLFIFVDTNPLSYVDSGEIGTWVKRQTPWGTSEPSFNHDYEAICNELALRPSIGLSTPGLKKLHIVNGADRPEFEAYASRPDSPRVGARFVKRPKRV